MSKILVVALKKSYENEYRKALSDNSDVSFDSIQYCCHKNSENFDIPKHFQALKLNIFKDVEKEYVYDSTEKRINSDLYDYILFAGNRGLNTFYSIIEYCERNDIPVEKVLFKNIIDPILTTPADVINIENTQHFFDMSIDDFVA